ncbi:MAG: hypothetical protein JJD92_13995 [Frankiaceae bacterium]|nr:hypothetical protein [Frankiaceae bacterium]
MLWVIVDIVLAVLALAGLGLVVLNLWRKVKELGREVARAGEAISAATDQLADVQAQLPPHA